VRNHAFEDVVVSKLLGGLLSNLVILEGKLKSPTETVPDYKRCTRREMKPELVSHVVLA
jgi:hypothetical protein